MTRRPGIVRFTAMVVGGAGMIAAASILPGVVDMSNPADAVAAEAVTPTQGANEVATSAATLVCPGPETEGLPAVAPLPGTTAVHAAAAPRQVLGEAVALDDTGALTLRGSAHDGELATSSARGPVVSAPVSGATPVQVQATGAMAPGLAALQTSLRVGDDERGLEAAPCRAGAPELWLLGGGGDATRRERLVLANAGANAVTASVAVHGAAGLLESTAPSEVTVPPNGRVSLLLDALVPSEATPAVHVTATGGLLGALLEDSWIEGAVGRGRDDSVPSTGPALAQVIPGVGIDGPGRIRILVPGDQEAVVQTRLLTTSGSQPVPTDAVVRIASGAVRDVDLGAVPPGNYAVEVRADQPVVAAVMTERRTGAEGPSDLAWVPGTEALDYLGGTPLPSGPGAAVHLAATGEAARVSVFTVDAAGAATGRLVDVGADAVTAVDVSGASQVWVRREFGTVRAAVALVGTDPDGPLYSVIPLGPSTVTTPHVPARPIRR